ncbi:MAG: response regulator [Candidatus Aminicenantes bacterium]|nr:response regulator [Candidatus Aminicenantes bacterium]
MTKANILIVEDESIIASVIAAALKKFEYEVIDILNTGEAAAVAALRKKPDLILMDIRLQGELDGIGAVELIQKQMDIPVIYLTAYADEPTLERAKKTKPYGYIPKPFQEIELKTTIEMALYKHGFELQLKESEAKFRSLFENSQDVIYFSDKNGKLLEMNPAGLYLFGYELDEILRTHPEQLYSDPNDRKPFLTQLKNHKNLKECELKLRNKKGDILYCLETANAMLDKDGHTNGFQGIIRDISGQKRLEAERQSLEAQLFQAQKMEALGQLAGGVAHDFNNLLTGIRGFAQFAFNETPQDSPTRADLTEVLKLSKRAEALTRQLLAFSHKQTLEHEVLTINQTVKEMMNMLIRLIGKKIELDFVLAPDLGNVDADPGQLEQMLVNLTLNARDAMPGGGKLTVETANVFLDQDYARAHIGVTPGDYIMLAISDTGCGMDDNICPHIFEPFFTTKPPGKGTGLGLSTVYGIVKQLKGSIGVDSKPGQGTIFKIYLPRVAAAAVEKTPGAARKEPRTPETILIVEDDAAVLQIARRAIEVCGYRVLTAASPGAAEKILAAQAEAVDLILIDVVLPEINGYQLFASWHRQYPRLRVLYMSGYMDNAIVTNDILARGLPFIQKPFTAEDLVLTILKIMGEKHHD